MKFIFCKRHLIYFIALIVLTIFYATLSRNILPSSDAVSVMLEGKDVASGNLGLAGWYLSTVSFYFTEVIWYALATKLTGYSSHQAYIIPALMYSCLVLIAFYLSREKLGSVWALIFSIGIPSAFASLNTLIPVIHIGTYVYTLISYILIEKYTNKKELKYLVAFILLATLTCFSDDISNYILIAPLFLSGLFFCVKNKSLYNLYVVMAVLIAYALAKAMQYYASISGLFILPGIPSPQFIDFDLIGKNLYLFTEGMLRYTGSFFFGKSPSEPEAIKSVILLIVFALFCTHTYKALRISYKISIVDMSLCVACLIMIPAFVLSNRPIDVWSIRYLVPFFIFAPIIIGRAKTTNGLIYYILAVFLVVFLAYGSGFSQRTDHSNDILNKLKTTLRENGLKDGYGSFWFASSLSIDGDLKVAPLDVNRVLNIFACNKWLSKNDWYSTGGNFIIIDDDQMRDIALKEVGNPVKVIKTGDKSIFIYNKNITYSCQ
ncbi:hypothetical protein DBP88_07070 [Enterobacter hormaechei]|nr:hypothetical protein DBP88_07070 [Enterobacter hormaechei]ESM22255.1 hypothetical protein L414_01073 [Enterobacter hormaechei subsp. hoffmannii UCICRE 3]